MAALQMLAIPMGIAALCALPSTRIHRFHHVPKPLGRGTGGGGRPKLGGCIARENDAASHAVVRQSALQI
jgi:hypothetical protein